MDFSQFHGTTGGSHICQGVIKKLFPTKLYGFVVCECLEHTGEAHFNYSDLSNPNVAEFLCVGWRVTFAVEKQLRPTEFCAYRAVQVKPVDAMVVQCELTYQNGSEGTLQSKELGGKKFSVRKERYNGKFAGSREQPELCRALISWITLTSEKPSVIHCSEEVSTNISRPPNSGKSFAKPTPTMDGSLVRHFSNRSRLGSAYSYIGKGFETSTPSGSPHLPCDVQRKVAHSSFEASPRTTPSKGSSLRNQKRPAQCPRSLDFFASLDPRSPAYRDFLPQDESIVDEGLGQDHGCTFSDSPTWTWQNGDGTPITLANDSFFDIQRNLDSFLVEDN